MKKMNKKGFTIVELVIVIAVIAVLAAVLIPTFGGMIDKANESKALSNAKNALTVVSVVTAEDGIVDATPDAYIAVKLDDKTTYYFEYDNGALNADGTTEAPTLTGYDAFTKASTTDDAYWANLGNDVTVYLAKPAA